MEFQVQRFDELYECGQQIVQYVDDKQAIQRISCQLEDVQERWETLVQNMGTQSKEVRGMTCLDFLFSEFGILYIPFRYFSNPPQCQLFL